MKLKYLAPLALLPVALSAGITFTDTTPFGLYDTGLGALDNPDPYWNWVNTASMEDAFRISPHPNWDSTTPGDWIWITETPSGTSTAPIGSWTFALTFDLTGYDPNNTTIKGVWGSDNTASISLAGQSIAGSGLSGSVFSSLKDFEINGGLLGSTNTLLVTVENEYLSGTNAGDWNHNPGGLKLRFTEITTTPVPEPSTLLGALTLSSLGLLFLRRRR